MEQKPVSTTAISEWKKEFPKEAISFEEPICPHCNSKLILDYTSTRHDDQLNTKYICTNCGFMCPIGHAKDNYENIYPLYDGTIHEFLKNFGDRTDKNRFLFHKVLKDN